MVSQNIPIQEIAAAETQALCAMEPGQVALLTDVCAPDQEVLRLKALGICVGRSIQLVRAGDPMIVRVMGARVGMSASLAGQIRVAMQ